VSDDLGLFSEDAGEPTRRSRRQARHDRQQYRRRRRRRTITALAGLCVLLLVGGGVLYGASQLLQLGQYEDYEGQGNGHVVVEVKSGDTTSDIGTTMSKLDVVASPKAFTKAAEENRQISGVQPGFYLMRAKMSGQAAVERILSPEAKVGRLEIRGGMRLEDQAAPDGKVTPGILTQLAAASCAEMNGQKKCVAREEVHAVAEKADLASLGVPEWAIGPASAVEPRRRLEGLIMPGVYDVKPGENAQELLRSVVTRSAAQLELAGLPKAAEGTRFSPYQLLTIASLAQSEAIAQDFDKVARVIENRLGAAMPLQFDSTINYPLDKPTLLTKPEDRQREGPYNTYVVKGLPPTPISSASKEAVKAAEKPAPGGWVYFVKCYKNGTSCFSETPEQHDAAKREAQQRGAY
jgi:UPF0755 protein